MEIRLNCGCTVDAVYGDCYCCGHDEDNKNEYGCTDCDDLEIKAAVKEQHKDKFCQVYLCFNSNMHGQRLCTVHAHFYGFYNRNR